MAREVQYNEGLPSLTVDDGTSEGVLAELGVPVTVPDEIAERLLEQGWEEVGAAPAKKPDAPEKKPDEKSGPPTPAGKAPAAPPKESD